ncbi:hypothetical protein B0H14DRAFT_2723104 [Mycena olivaceomarginata]|nr:hypothetical protein B0H14DRAFT_2723104 [Mycena olivaceomarginata]
MYQAKLAVASTPAKHLILVQAQKWLAVIKTNQSVHLSGEEHLDGTERRGIRSSDLILFIGKATKIPSPSMRYTNWDLELELESPEAEETPRKPSAKAKGKGKARARSVSPVVKLEKVEAETSEEDTSDMKAAKMHTRLDTQSIKRKVFRMPDNSDDERPVIFEVDDSDDKVTFPKPATLFSQSPLFSSFLSPDGDVISPFPSQASFPYCR